MNKTFKIILYSLITLGIIVVIASFIANSVIKKKVETLISSGLPNHITASYKEIYIHTLDGSVTLKNPTLVIQNEEDKVKYSFVDAENLKITNISYWDYIFKNEIHIDKIILDNPTITYYKDRVIQNKDSTQKSAEIKKPIFVDHFLLNHSKWTVYEKDKDSTKLFLNNFSLEIHDIEVNYETLKGKIPIGYKEVKAKSDSIFVKANAYNNLTIQNFSLEDRNIVLNDLKYNTKYSRSELSRIIAVEQDHFDVSIESLSIHDYDFGFLEDSLFFAKAEKISLNTPSMDIFRDKLVTDDLTTKPLYSKSLRELPFDLTIKSIKINDGFLKYEEKVHEENNGGAIEFKNLNVDISNLSNTYRAPEKTNIEINAVFMDNAPLSINWSFDVQNLEDQFIFKADVGFLKAERMNRFTEPNLKVRLEGEANKTYFTIGGNNENSKIDLKIHFSDLKVTVLKKDGKDKNKFLSAVVNLFVSKDSEKSEDKFKEATGEATRDKTKSIFNFLWISVKSALQKTMI